VSGGRRGLAAILTAGAIAWPGSAAASPSPRSVWLEGFLGAALNAPTPLRIRQRGEPEIRTTAHYETRPFEPPLYYAARIGAAWGRQRWEVELIHHKLYLTRRPEAIQGFSISHGYNLVLVNRVGERRAWASRIGLGLVVAHPETRIRGSGGPRSGGLGGGYHLAGVAGQTAWGRGWRLAGGLHGRIEGKITVAFAEVPVAHGDARVPNVAVHLVAGLGWRSRPR
jgi:hypothetical protein